MSDLPVSRRGFVVGAGALAGATVFAPQALAQGLSDKPFAYRLERGQPRLL